MMIVRLHLVWLERRGIAMLSVLLRVGPVFSLVGCGKFMGQAFWKYLLHNGCQESLGCCVPCDSRNPTNPSKFELAIYPDLQVAQPRVVIALWKAHIEDPKFNQPDPALVIVDKATRKNHLSCGLRCRAGSSHLRKTHVHHLLEDQRPHTHCSRRRFRGLESTSISAMLNVSRQETRYKFLSAYEGDKQQIQWFYNACRGIFQQNSYIPVAPVGATTHCQPSIPKCTCTNHICSYTCCSRR
ncbi:putative RING zinc finger and ankyrin repeat containing protein [Iris pallida]|uniref:RING zinc finger and ankyrin repeat containing protein n=1 Tax=Iris pallida TaxID=29817 RepID=A0AAX6IM96_IRIPA|nr:putative RING zinc finger and ankyrin repeat containing protein [Iris pallida]